MSVHPSHTGISGAMGVDERAILEQVRREEVSKFAPNRTVGPQVRCPQLFLPAGNDGETVKKGGLADRVLGDKLKVK